MSKQEPKVIFRRINGRVVPIRIGRANMGPGAAPDNEADADRLYMKALNRNARPFRSGERMKLMGKVGALGAGLFGAVGAAASEAKSWKGRGKHGAIAGAVGFAVGAGLQATQRKTWDEAKVEKSFRYEVAKHQALKRRGLKR